MRLRKPAVATIALGAVVGVAALGVAAGTAGPAVSFTNVPAANTKSPGYSRPNGLSPELQELAWAQGSTPVENPSNGISFYGYDDGAPLVPVAGGGPGSITLPGAAQPPGQIEARKTEPDKNTYLVLKGQKGADPNYDYGTHFLYQGHELGAPGYITRVNLDADGAHRVTLLATKDTDGANLPNFDGSTWDPWAQRLLFTAELGTSGGVWQGTLGVPSTVVNLQRLLGRGGLEGIQNDDRGNLYYVEDVGGSNIVVNGSSTRARRPNSFVFRFLPEDPSDLTKGGEIQALQVLISGQPITFADGGTEPNPAKYVTLHTYKTPLKTKWITLATTTAATPAPGPDLNDLAKTTGATPFKRPENGLFRPGSHFKEFYFDETGDTNLDTPAAATGGFTGVFKLTQDPRSNDGTIRLFYLGDKDHAGFDNMAFFGESDLAFVEDAGDTLHTQRNALDSGWLLDAGADYSNASKKPIRFLAQGRDASATLDSALGSLYTSPAFYNDGDNEITGIHVSDGDPGKDGILGAKLPKPFRGEGGWRAFYTQQHGDQTTWELIRWSTHGDN
jgi:hypothetical protein